MLVSVANNHCCGWTSRCGYDCKTHCSNQHQETEKKNNSYLQDQKLHGLPWGQRARLVQGSALTGVKGGGLGFQGLTVADSSKHKDWELEEKRKNKRPKWSAVEIN